MTLSFPSAEASRRTASCLGPPLVGPMAFLLGATLLAGLLDLDLKVAAWFSDGQGGWTYGRNPLVRLIYRFGTYPALSGARRRRGPSWRGPPRPAGCWSHRSEEHTSELQSHSDLV